MRKYTDYEIDLLSKAARAMCGGPIKNYPELYTILKERGLIFESELDQPVNRFISDFRNILGDIYAASV